MAARPTKYPKIDYKSFEGETLWTDADFAACKKRSGEIFDRWVDQDEIIRQIRARIHPTSQDVDGDLEMVEVLEIIANPTEETITLDFDTIVSLKKSFNLSMEYLYHANSKWIKPKSPVHNKVITEHAEYNLIPPSNYYLLNKFENVFKLFVSDNQSVSWQYNVIDYSFMTKQTKGRSFFFISFDHDMSENGTFTPNLILEENDRIKYILSAKNASILYYESDTYCNLQDAIREDISYGDILAGGKINSFFFNGRSKSIFNIVLAFRANERGDHPFIYPANSVAIFMHYKLLCLNEILPIIDCFPFLFSEGRLVILESWKIFIDQMFKKFTTSNATRKRAIELTKFGIKGDDIFKFFDIGEGVRLLRNEFPLLQKIDPIPQIREYNLSFIGEKIANLSMAEKIFYAPLTNWLDDFLTSRPTKHMFLLICGPQDNGKTAFIQYLHSIGFIIYPIAASGGNKIYMNEYNPQYHQICTFEELKRSKLVENFEQFNRMTTSGNSASCKLQPNVIYTNPVYLILTSNECVKCLKSNVAMNGKPGKIESGCDAFFSRCRILELGTHLCTNDKWISTYRLQDILPPSNTLFPNNTIKKISIGWNMSKCIASIDKSNNNEQPEDRKEICVRFSIPKEEGGVEIVFFYSMIVLENNRVKSMKVYSAFDLIPGISIDYIDFFHLIDNAIVLEVCNIPLYFKENDRNRKLMIFNGNIRLNQPGQLFQIGFTWNDISTRLFRYVSNLIMNKKATFFQNPLNIAAVILSNPMHPSYALDLKCNFHTYQGVDEPVLIFDANTQLGICWKCIASNLKSVSNDLLGFYEEVVNL